MTNIGGDRVATLLGGGSERTGRQVGRAAFLILSVVVASGVGYGVTRLVSSPSSTSGPIVLLGDGIGTARFGQTEAVAIANLDKSLGSPRSDTPKKQKGDCNIDAYIEWQTAWAYFYHGHFVGYVTGPQKSKAATTKGLKVGDTVIQARKEYGTAFSTSRAQGGSWLATTPTGTLDGYLTSEPNLSTPVARIASIEAGAVGCPALSP